MELLIAIILLAMIILGINNIDIFSRYHFISTDRRVKVQNDASRCLEHMTKYLSTAIGNETAFGSNSVALVVPNSSLSIFTDANANGSIDAWPNDYWVRYKFNSSTHTLTYCPQCPNAACVSCSGTEEDLAKDITIFSPSIGNLATGSYVDVSLTACWDPATPATCGTSDNPGVTMSTSIILPSVSGN